MCREAYDDFVRYKRDKEVNSAKYKKLTKKGNGKDEINWKTMFSENSGQRALIQFLII